MTNDLFWHCLSCGAHEAVEPTGDDAPDGEYMLGDHEPCECGGEAHVMTIKMSAAYEQSLALGMPFKDAWARAQRYKPA